MLAFSIWASMWEMLAFPAPSRALAAHRFVVNVRDLGARGDGLADDYEALQRAVHSINDHHGGTLFFPPGRYRIDRFVETGPGSNGVQDLIFQGCDGLAVLGEHATIDLKGDFHRGADWTGPQGHHYSYRRCVQPLVFGACRNFRVEGLEIDGHVNLTTRAPNVSETPGSGIYTYECSDYLIRNVYVHHLPTDGIYLGGSPRQADRNAVLENVRSTHNARQGLSIIQLRGGSFIDCRFEKTGQTEGSYGGHWPMAGVDVEPEHDLPEVDVRTGELTFLNCAFKGNVGDQFISLAGSAAESVRLEHCEISQESDRFPYGLRLAINGGHILRSRLVVKRVDPSWSGVPSRTTIDDCDILSDGEAFHSAQDAVVCIERCRIIGRHREPTSTPFILLQNKSASFRSNVVYMPPVASECRCPGVVLDIGASSNNLFVFPPGASPSDVKYGRSRPDGDRALEQVGPPIRSQRPIRLPGNIKPSRG